MLRISNLFVFSTNLTGADFSQKLEAVNPCLMPVAPVEADRIVADRNLLPRSDILGDLIERDPRFARHFISATGTGTVDAEVIVAVKAPMPVFPYHQQLFFCDIAEVQRFHDHVARTLRFAPSPSLAACFFASGFV